MVIASVVAVQDGEIVGHILYSDLIIETEMGPSVPGVALILDIDLKLLRERPSVAAEALVL
jgi:hypothetical protein